MVHETPCVSVTVMVPVDDHVTHKNFPFRAIIEETFGSNAPQKALKAFLMWKVTHYYQQ